MKVGIKTNTQSLLLCWAKFEFVGWSLCAILQHPNKSRLSTGCFNLQAFVLFVFFVVIFFRSLSDKPRLAE